MDTPNISTEDEEQLIEVVSPEQAAREIENRASFKRRLSTLSEEQMMLVDTAYDQSKEAMRPFLRETGERSFEHARRVSLIMIDELRILYPNFIIACLLHDTVEDSGMYANIHEAMSVWQKTARFRLSRLFNDEVADDVIALTTPKKNDIDVLTKEQGHQIYMDGLYQAPPRVILAKMCDRTDNLRTLAGTRREKQVKIVTETRNEYLELFKRVLEEFKSEGEYLFAEIQKAMDALNVPA